MVEKIRKAAGGLRGKTVGLLGSPLSPTPMISASHRQSRFSGNSSAAGTVRVYDPAAGAAAKEEIPGLDLRQDVDSVARGADALVIATEWNQFGTWIFPR